MKTLLILLSTSLLSAIGWHVGAKVGMGTAWLLSSVGLIAGVWVGWKLWREFFDI